MRIRHDPADSISTFRPTCIQVALATLCLLALPGVVSASGRSLLDAGNCGGLGESCCTQGDSFSCDAGLRLLCDTASTVDAGPTCVSCGGDGETPCGATPCHNRHSTGLLGSLQSECYFCGGGVVMLRPQVHAAVSQFAVKVSGMKPLCILHGCWWPWITRGRFVLIV